MRKFLLLSLAVFTVFTVFAQDFSNKGKDFYLCFPQHVPSGANARLSVWITSDKASSGTITMASGAFSSTFNIAANGLAEIDIPYNAAHISNLESTTEFFTQILKKSIRVKVDAGKPAVVAYVQQYGNARSAASLLLPVNVLGKKYYAISFNQNGTADNPSGTNNSRSQFQIIAVKNNTVVTISLMKNGLKSNSFTVTLPLAGDMIQYQSPDPNAISQDITGTLIESVASGSGGCLPIAVFSGSSNLRIGTQTPNCLNNSYDPLLQQLYPVSTWGMSFGFIPLANYPAGVPYRVMASEDNTNVYFDGALVANLNAGQIYPAAFTSNPVTITNPTSITANKPICVAEYAQSSGCAGNGAGGNQGDPDMVILNPIEQNISDITIFSTRQQVINTQWLNILLKTAATASFRISRNGGPLLPPTGTWQTFATLPGYSYLRELLPSPTGISDSYRLLADSGFNAIAYGLGTNETYAYSAGTYIKDLNSPGVSSGYGIENNKVCLGESFKLKVPLPYLADSIFWDLSNLPGGYPNVWTLYPPGTPDSTTGTAFKPIYWYSLPTNFSVNIAGTYPIKVTTYSQNTDGCGNEQDVEFEVEITDPPVSDFTWINPQCAAETVQFNDASTTSNPFYNWWWDFGDAASGLNNNATIANPTHIFTAPGTYDVRYVNITTPGCVSDTIHHFVNVAPLPTATIDGTNTVCINTAAVPIIFAGAGSAAPYTFYYHVTPGGSFSVNSIGSTAQIMHNPNTAGTFVYTLDSVRNVGSALCVQTITGQQVTITVTPDATVTLRAGDNANPTVCINNVIADIRYDIGGSGTGGSVSGLPTGVTGIYAGGFITILGTPTVAGTFIYTINPTGPCAFPIPAITGTITVNNDATIVLNSAAGTDNQTRCINTSITNIDYLVGGGGTGATISWTPATPTGISFTPIGGGLFRIGGVSSVSGTFNYTITTTGPCIKPSLGGTLTVTPNATLLLTSAPATTNQTVCVNNIITQITYQVGGSGTGANVVFTPLLPGVTGTYAGGIVTIQGTPTISGTFSYTVTPIGPCVNPPLGGTITVNNDATIVLNSAAGTDNQTRCINTAVTNIDYLIGGGGTGATISWTPAIPTGISLTPVGGGLFRIGGASSVSGIFNYTITTTGPCIKPSLGGTLTVTPDATLLLTSAPATTNQTVCVNNIITQITYQVGGSGTGANVVFTPLLPGVTGTYAGGIVTIQGTPTISGTFNYTVTPVGPCVNPPLGGTVTVNADATISLTSAAATANQTVCMNNTISNITYQIGGSGTGANVLFTPALPGVSGTYSGGIFTIQGAPTITGTFNYTVTTTGPCIKPSLTGSITVNPIPTASFTGTTEVCQNNPVWPGVTFTGANGAAPYTFTYSVNGGANQIVTTTVGNSVAVQQSTVAAGTFIYKLLSVQDGSITACSQSVNVPDQTVKVNPLPTASVSGSKLVCINSMPPDITFTGAGGTAPYTFTYRVNGGAPQTISSTGTNSSVSFAAPTGTAGAFNYVLESVQDGSSTACIQAQAGNVTIDVSDVFPVSDFWFNDPVCLPNAVVQFQNLSSISNGTGLAFQWNFGDGSNPSSGLNPVHQYYTAGPFNATLRAISNAGCETTKIIPLNNIHPQPKADFSINSPTGVCIGSDVTLTDQSNGIDGTINQWNWNLGDGTTRTTNTVTYRYTDTLTYNISLYTVNSFGCNSDTISKLFTVHPFPKVNAGPDRFILEGGQITLIPVVYGNDLQFLWTPDLYLIDNKVEKVKVNRPLTDMTYTLKVTARGGCSFTDDVFIKLLKFPKIPNTFTPNNDGINDTWRIDYLDTYPENRVQVFTRTGQLVFESRGYTTPWDGTIKGKPLPFDTYYYIIEPGNGRDPITGYVTIIK